MKNKILLLSALVFGCSFLFSSCGDFLEEYSQNLTYVKTAEDLDQLLVGTDTGSTGCGVFLQIATFYTYYTLGHTPITTGTSASENLIWPWIHLMDDDCEAFRRGNIPSTGVGAAFYTYHDVHNWQATPFIKSNEEEFGDYNWSRIYRAIAIANAAIYRAGELRGKEPNAALLDRVEGEARTMRAAYYLLLANIYGSPYCKATASEDLCVPLKTSPEIEDKYFSRDTHAKVYGQIVEDLKRAVALFNGYIPTSPLRAGADAANALLSRVCLYMEDYEGAVAAADAVLQHAKYSNKDVLDLSALTFISQESASGSLVAYNSSNTTGSLYRTSPETIFTTGGHQLGVLFMSDQISTSSGHADMAARFRASQDLMACYTPTDLRRQGFFIRTRQSASFMPRKYRGSSAITAPELVSDVFLVRLPEVLLNKAEAQAMLNLDGDARETLDVLRRKRFKPADFVSTSGSGQALVNFIRDERRRELCFEGHRWFDLRRYAVNSKYPLPETFSIKHNEYEFNGAVVVQTGYYELKSYKQDKACWTMPIPKSTIEFNRGSLTNEIRTERKMIVL